MTDYTIFATKQKQQPAAKIFFKKAPNQTKKKVNHTQKSQPKKKNPSNPLRSFTHH